MPFASDRQRKAMYAAAAGHSRVEIPQAAAKRFIAHAKAKALRKRVGERLRKG